MKTVQIKNNYFFISALFIVLCMNSAAQTFKGNLIGGISSSQASGDGTAGFVQFGVYAGIGVEARINDVWSLHGNLMFNQKGSRVYKTKNNFNTYRLRVNYIEVPVLLDYRYQKFSAQLGPYLGVKINQKEQTQYGVIENPRAFKPFDFGIQAQISCQLKERIKLSLAFQNSILPARAHESQLAYPPSNFVLGEWHQKILDKGQYFTTLMLFLSYRLGN
jgi:hypothetical protein